MTDEEIRAEAEKRYNSMGKFENIAFINGAKWHREQSDASLRIAMEALDKIAHPILHLRKEADEQGARLDGYMALQVVANKELYIGIATKALEQINKQDE